MESDQKIFKYSWGGYVDAVTSCENLSYEKLIEIDPVFIFLKELENTCTYEGVKSVLKRISPEVQNKLNSYVLDIITESMKTLVNQYPHHYPLMYALRTRNLEATKFLSSRQSYMTLHLDNIIKKGHFTKEKIIPDMSRPFFVKKPRQQNFRIF